MRVATFLALLATGALARADALRDDLNRGIEFLEKRIASDPDDFIAANQLATRLTRRSSWTGSLNDLRRANAVIAQSLRVVAAEENAGALSLAGRIALAMHRFAEAKRISEQLLHLQPAKSSPYFLLGDACMELGELNKADEAFAEVIKRDGNGIMSEARRARLESLRGNFELASEHIEGALNFARELPPADMDTLVWCLIQRGEYAFKRGDWETAGKAYEEAGKLAPDHWSTLEHLAELRAAQAKDTEAVELFVKAAQAADRPDLWQALGDCHSFFKRIPESKAAYERALAGYTASIERGEVLYIHHLAGFYSDSRENAEDAVKWARKDLEIRQTGAAHDALAWALYKSGDLANAMVSSKRALQTGLADAHVLYHAAMIHLSSGDVAEGQRLLRKCAEVNPHFQSFHVHR